MYQIESIIAIQTRHINIFRKDQDHQYRNGKHCFAWRERAFNIGSCKYRTFFKMVQIGPVPPTNREHCTDSR